MKNMNMGNTDRRNVGATETVLAEILHLCDEVLDGKRKVDGTFFSTRREAAKLRLACENGDAAETLCQLRSFRGEPSPADLISRLEEAIMANQEQQTSGSAGNNDSLVQAVEEKVPAVVGSPMPVIMMPVKELSPHPLVEDLYPIYPDVLTGMTESMKERGYDCRHPMQVCRTGNKYHVWDGLTRRNAAIDAGIEVVPVLVSEFASDDDLMESVIEAQHRRRNCTAQVLIVSVEKLTEIAGTRARAGQGRRSDLVTSGQICPEVESGGANEYIAKLVGKSATMVKHVKEIIGNPGLRKKVMEGDLSLNQAYEKLHPVRPSMEKILAFGAGVKDGGRPGAEAPVPQDAKTVAGKKPIKETKELEELRQLKQLKEPQQPMELEQLKELGIGTETAKYGTILISDFAEMVAWTPASKESRLREIGLNNDKLLLSVVTEYLKSVSGDLKEGVK